LLTVFFVCADCAERARAAKDKKIDKLLDFCAKHGDQRSFAELLAQMDELRQWNQQRVNIGSAHNMDLNTLTEQWFLTANLIGISKEMRFLCSLRQGEFYERLSVLADAGGIELVDELGNAQHYTSALDYLRRVFKYEKKDEDQLRSCHQFFEVWKEWHPIIAVAQGEFRWSWMKVGTHAQSAQSLHTVCTQSAQNTHFFFSALLRRLCCPRSSCSKPFARARRFKRSDPLCQRRCRTPFHSAGARSTPVVLSHPSRSPVSWVWRRILVPSPWSRSSRTSPSPPRRRRTSSPRRSRRWRA
jgi:hypothetical protein